MTHEQTRKSIWLFILLAVLSVSNFGQENLVKKICAETNENLQVELWIINSTVAFGEDLKIYFKITNKGKKQIYLVKKSQIEVDSNKGRILIQAPLPYPREKNEYDYSFIKISPKKSYQNDFTIPGEKINEPGEMQIFVGMGFVSSIDEIQQELKLGENPFAVRSALANKMKTFGLGEIEINVIRAK